jgi:two-component system sensor histidine kinase PilS (NtrC family)
MPAAVGAPEEHSAKTATDWAPLRLLTFYRVILAGLLMVLFLALPASNPFSVQSPALFRSTLLAYLAFSILAGFSTRVRWPGYELQALFQVFADIGAIALLMHASTGVVSTLSVLLVTAVAFGALVLPGRLAYLFAAVATLAILYETGLASLSPERTDASDITRAGILGAVLFMAAGLAHMLVIRARESAALAERRGIDLANLEQLNRYIVQQLESGLLVIDPDSNVRLANDNARTMLGMADSALQKLDVLAPELATEFWYWRRDPQWQPRPLKRGDSGTALIPRFSGLTTSHGQGALILLDDSARLAQQAQQLKLASLGRLTASIAHEIRNPLGAISHAAQLLSESEQLNAGDKRLTEIIGNHTQRVNTIIENVLQLSRRSASQPQQLPLGEWLRLFGEEFTQSQGVAAERLSVDINPPDIQVQIDPGHLHQVLTNLCENALRHARGDSAPVRLRVRRTESGLVYLDVIDNGPGIDPATAEQMFEPFYTTATSGTGLGLYIARELCEINQAQLSYYPLEDGSCFRIQFPQATG